MRFVLLLTFALLVGPPAAAQAQQVEVVSPGGSVQAIVSVDGPPTLRILHRGAQVLAVSDIGLEVEHSPWSSEGLRLRQVDRRSVDEVIRPEVPEKRSLIPDRYNEARVLLHEALALTVRAYDDGVAYRFETAIEDSITVRDERLSIQLGAADSLVVPLVNCPELQDCFHSSFEEDYLTLGAQELPPGRLAYLPLLVRSPNGLVWIAESDLWDYPGLWFTPALDRPALLARFPAYPAEEVIVGEEFKQRRVSRRAEYIARTGGTRTFPWRVFGLASRDADLLTNDMVYRLARPLMIEDASWIRPGFSTEEWITSRLLYDVDFVSGLNTDTYRYFIDFAARYGLPYMMFDAGWSNNDDLSQLNPDIDVRGLIEYARSKGVGILLWNLALALERDLGPALDRYEAWGIKGIMVDFMDRDDQKTVRFYERVAREAAARRLMVNFHGAFKPTGLRRAYPNVITREAVMGHEFNMWSERVTPDHALTIPFVRMPAGPMDYEGGCMNNGTREDFRVVFPRPMCQGTRTQQMAQYVVYESPLHYFAGSPSDYEREPEFTGVMARIPTTWDETIALDGRVGDFVAIARRKGEIWYVAAMTDWTPRTLEIPLDFLGAGDFLATIVADGLNAHRYAGDYRIEQVQVGSEDVLQADMAPGGGWVAEIRRR